MFVHEAVQDVLVPMPLYGSDVIHLNVPDTEYVARSADHFLQYRYVVSVTAYNRRSTVDLPCYQVGEAEKKGSCLTWRGEASHTRMRC